MRRNAQPALSGAAESPRDSGGFESDDVGSGCGHRGGHTEASEREDGIEKRRSGSQNRSQKWRMRRDLEGVYIA